MLHSSACVNKAVILLIAVLVLSSRVIRSAKKKKNITPLVFKTLKATFVQLTSTIHFPLIENSSVLYGSRKLVLLVSMLNKPWLTEALHIHNRFTFATSCETPFSQQETFINSNFLLCYSGTVWPFRPSSRLNSFCQSSVGAFTPWLCAIYRGCWYVKTKGKTHTTHQQATYLNRRPRCTHKPPCLSVDWPSWHCFE